MLKSAFARSVGSMMAYTALGQSIFLLTGPLIGRIYSPAEFGLYGLFYAFAVTAIGLIFLNYDFAIPAAFSTREANRLTRGSIIIVLLLCPMAALVMSAMILFNLADFGKLTLSAPLLLLALLLSQAVVQLLQSWNIRRQQTIIIGKASVTLNAVRGVIQVGFGLLMPSWIALIAGEILGRMGNALHLARASRTRWRKGVFHRIAHRGNRDMLHRYREFPLILLPAQTVDGMVSFVQSAGIAYLYGPAGLGLFFMMRRTLDMPVAFAFRSLSDLFYAKLSKDARERPADVRPFFVRSVLLIAATGFAIGTPVIFISADLFALFFGEQWQEAGVLAAVMAPAAVLNLAIAPVARIFALTSRPYLRYWFSAANLAGTLGALGIAYALDTSLVYATALVSAATVFAYTVYFASGYVASAHLRTESASKRPNV